MRQIGRFIGGVLPLFFGFFLGAVPGLTPCLRWFRLIEKNTVAETSMLLAIPLENLGLVLFANRCAFHAILLKKQVEWPITPASFSHMQQLIVIPVLSKHFFGPCGLPVEKLGDVLGATRADKRSEEYNCMGGEVHLAVEAPFIVGVLKHLLQVGRKLRVNHRLTRRKSHNRLTRRLRIFNADILKLGHFVVTIFVLL